MSGLPFTPPIMTPLERLIDGHRTDFMLRHWYELTEWEAKTRAEISALVEHHNRSLGQLFRYAAARLAAKHGDIK